MSNPQKAYPFHLLSQAVTAIQYCTTTTIRMSTNLQASKGKSLRHTTRTKAQVSK